MHKDALIYFLLGSICVSSIGGNFNQNEYHEELIQRINALEQKLNHEYQADGSDRMVIDGVTYVLDLNEERNPVLVPYQNNQ